MTEERHTPLILSAAIIGEITRSEPGPGIDAQAYVGRGRFLSRAAEVSAEVFWDESDERYELIEETPWAPPRPLFVPHRPWRPDWEIEDERRVVELRDRVEARKAGKKFPGDEGYQEGDER